MGIEFKRLHDYIRGLLVELLSDAYAFNGDVEGAYRVKWLEDDEFFFENPQIADKCCFITALDGEAIGFLAWDPREMPERAIIGDNCIRSRYKGNGYGKMQLQEAIRRIAQYRVDRIVVTTNDVLVSAQRNYESVGFKVSRRREAGGFLGDLIDYEYILV